MKILGDLNNGAVAVGAICTVRASHFHILWLLEVVGAAPAQRNCKEVSVQQG